jgi:nucleoid-associated protein YgaU
MKAERDRRAAEAKEHQDALAKAKSEREAAAKAAAETKAAAEVEAKESATSGDTAIMTEHTVVAGDNLSMISQKYYGTQTNWRLIYEANKQVIGDNPSLIRVGQVLRIPKL